MAITDKRIIGRRVTITCGGIKTIWDTLSISDKYNTSDGTASDSTLDEVVKTTELLEGSLSGFLGAVNNGGTLPAKGADIDDFDVSMTVGGDSVLPDFSAYTDIQVLSVKYDIKKDPSTWSFDFRSGVLN